MTSLHCSDNSPLSWRLTANSFTSVLIARQCSDTTLLFCITCHKYLDIYAFDLTFHYCPDISPPSKTSDHFWHLVTVLTNSPLFWRLFPVLTLSHVVLTSHHDPDNSPLFWHLITVLTSHHRPNISTRAWKVTTVLFIYRPSLSRPSGWGDLSFSSL